MGWRSIWKFFGKEDATYKCLYFQVPAK